MPQRSRQYDDPPQSVPPPGQDQEEEQPSVAMSPPAPAKKNEQPQREVLDLDRAFFNLPPEEVRVAFSRALGEKKPVVVTMQTLSKMYPQDTAKAAEAFTKKGGQIVSKPAVSIDDIDGGQATEYMKAGIPVSFNLENLIHGDPAATADQWKPAFDMMRQQGYRPRVSRRTLSSLYPNDPNAEKNVRLKGWDVYDTATAREIIEQIPRQEKAGTAYFALDEVKAKGGQGGRYRVYISSGKAKEDEKALSGMFGGAPRTVFALPLNELPGDLQVEYQADGSGGVMMEGSVADLPKSFKPWSSGLKRFFVSDGKARAHPPDLATGEYIYNVLKDPDKNLFQKGWTAIMGVTLGQVGRGVEEIGSRMQQTAEIATMGLNTKVSPQDIKAPGRFSIGVLNVLGESISGLGRAAMEIATPEYAEGQLDSLVNQATFGIPAIAGLSRSIDYRIKRGVDPWDAIIRSSEESFGPMMKAGNRAAAVVYAKPAMIFGLAEALYSGSMAAVTGQERPGAAPGADASKVDQFRARPVSTAFSLFGLPSAGLKSMGFSEEFSREAEGVLMLAAMDGVMRAAGARKSPQERNRAAVVQARKDLTVLLNQRREVLKASGEKPPPWLDENMDPFDAVREAQKSIGQARDAVKAEMADQFLRAALGEEFVRDVQAPTADQLRMIAEMQQRATATGPEADYYRKTKLSAREEAIRRQVEENREETLEQQSRREPGEIFGRPVSGKSAEASAREFQMQQGGKTAAESAAVFKEAASKLPGEIAAERAEARAATERQAMLSREVGKAVGKKAQESARTMQENQRRASQSAEVFTEATENKITPQTIVEDIKAGRMTLKQGADQLRGLLDITNARRERIAKGIYENERQIPPAGNAAKTGKVQGSADLQRPAQEAPGNAQETLVTHQMPTGETMAGPEHPGAVPGSTEVAAAGASHPHGLNQRQIDTLELLIQDGSKPRLKKGGGFVRDSQGKVVKRIGAESGYGPLYRYLFGRGKHEKGKKKKDQLDRGGPLSGEHKEDMLRMMRKAIDGKPLTKAQRRKLNIILDADQMLNAEAYKEAMVTDFRPEDAEVPDPPEIRGHEVGSLRTASVGTTFEFAGEKHTVTDRNGSIVEISNGGKFKIDADRETVLMDRHTYEDPTIENTFDVAEIEAAIAAEASVNAAPIEPAPPVPAGESLTVRGQEFKYQDMPDVYKGMPEAELKKSAADGIAWAQLEVKHRGLTTEKQPLSEAMRNVADSLEAKAAEYRKKTGQSSANPWADPNMWGYAVHGLAADLVRGAAHVVDFATWSAHAAKQFGQAAEDRMRQMWDEAHRIAEAVGWKPPEPPAPSPGTLKPAAEAPAAGLPPARGVGPAPTSQRVSIVPEAIKPLRAPGEIVPRPKPSTVDVVTNAPKVYWEKDLGPKTKGKVATVVNGIKAAWHTLNPTTGVEKENLDILHRLTGERERAHFVISQSLREVQKWFDKSGKQTGIDFFDRLARGADQGSPELNEFATFWRNMEDSLWGELRNYKETLPYLENHVRPIWKVVPGTAGEGFFPLGKKPLRGSQGWAKKHTLADISEGIARGGEPITYNPVEMFIHTYDDAMKFVTAQKMLSKLTEHGLAFKGKEGLPGFVEVSDKLFQVHPDSPVKYWVDEGMGRLLNNYVSSKGVWGSDIGRAAMEIKNTTTMIELAVNGFHATFEGLETISSALGRGVREIVNVPGIESKTRGVKTLATAAVSPIEAFRTGDKILKSFSDEKFWKTPAGEKLA